MPRDGLVEATQGDMEGLDASFGQGDLRLQAASFGGLVPQGLEGGFEFPAHRDELPTGFGEVAGVARNGCSRRGGLPYSAHHVWFHVGTNVGEASSPFGRRQELQTHPHPRSRAPM